MADLQGVHVACLVCEGFEWAELDQPVRALRDAGAVVDVISERRGPVRGFEHHDPNGTVEANLTFDEAQPSRYDALLLPGGALNADLLRTIRQARAFAQAFDREGKPIAAICHAPWVLASAGVVDGRTLTSYYTIADDLRNAGARWVDREVVVDRNLVTARKPSDLPAFQRALARLIGEHRVASAASARDATDGEPVEPQPYHHSPS
ncbi:MAG: type 1 glutamine amidotransferase [Candidatus Eremiobacteraeota bacterium]|nr:type 1 glutamine amidotransferase [Candidatus Eremiobacteraeota bacterium]